MYLFWENETFEKNNFFLEKMYFFDKNIKEINKSHILKGGQKIAKTDGTADNIINGNKLNRTTWYFFQTSKAGLT